MRGVIGNMYEWVFRTGAVKRGKVVINRGQFLALATLKESKDKGSPWACLKGYQQRNLTAMQRADWIVKSVGKDGVKYAITLRGERVLVEFAESKHRKDGKCARCGKVERVGGKSYCKSCVADISRERYARLTAQGKSRLSDTLCNYCDKPRHKTRNGIIFYALCDEHLQEYLRGKAAKYRQQRRANVSANVVCYCGQPVHVTNKDAYHLCTEHYKQALKRKMLKAKRKKYDQILAVHNRYSTK